jgi:DNA repair protein RecO
MSHHIYQTRGYILKTFASGEAGLFLRIYTRDLGLIQATAQGARYLKSKLRYSLQETSESQLSLVRGKDIWRITNARLEQNLFTQFREREHALAAAVKILALVERLVQGEEKHDELFTMMYEAFEFLKAETLSEEETELFQSIATLKILNLLGYGADSTKLTRFIESPWSSDLVKDMKTDKLEAKREIDRALRESQL